MNAQVHMYMYMYYTCTLPCVLIQEVVEQCTEVKHKVMGNLMNVHIILDYIQYSISVVKLLWGICTPDVGWCVRGMGSVVCGGGRV